MCVEEWEAYSVSLSRSLSFFSVIVVKVSLRDCIDWS